MKKKAVVIAMAAALAVSQYAAVFAANSPGTGVVIPNEDSDGDYDIGERVDQVTPRREDRPQPRLRFPLKAEQPARAAARP